MNNVLVVQLARFGDILQTKRLILTLAKEAQVHLCVDESLISIASLIYPYATIHGISAHAPNGCENIARAHTLSMAKKTLCALHSIDFTHVYTLNASPLSYAVAALFPPEIVHGYFLKNGQASRDLWCQMAPRLTLNRISSPLNLVDYWGYFHPFPIDSLSVNPPAKQAGSGRIGIVMAGKSPRRSLPPEVLAGCVEAIFQGKNAPTIVCLGGKEESVLVRRMARHLSSPVLKRLEDQTGRTSLTDLPEILTGLDCLVTPDTGIMHLAAHLGTPIEAFFLSSAWVFETGPYGMGHTIWQATTNCAPCLESAPCHNNTQCLSVFSHKNFLLRLRGYFDQPWPENLNNYTGNFDSLGAIYSLVEGTDPHAPARQALRSCVGEWLNKLPFNITAQAGAESFYHEKDWMLPIRK